MGKKKRMREVDIDALDQKKLLDELNNCIDAGVLPASNEDILDDDNDDTMLDYVQAAFAQRQAERSNNHGGEHITVSEVIEEDITDTEDVPLKEYVKERVEEAITMNQITFEKVEHAEFKIIRISDGVRTIDIDVNTIGEDEETMSDENIYDTSDRILPYIIRNLYPSAIISPAAVTETFDHIVEIDNSRYYFFDYPYGDGSIVLGYYISESVCETYGEIIEELAECHKALTFLAAVLDIVSGPGVSIGCMNPTYVMQMMLLSSVNSSTGNFIKTLIFDEDTVLDETRHNSSIYDAVPVLPFIDEEETVTEDTSYTETVVSEEVTTIETTEEVDTVETDVPATVEEALAETSVGEIEEEDNTDNFFGDDDDFVDPDEMEEMYFGKKSKQVDTFKSYNKKQSNNDEPKSMIVERHVK